MQAPQEPGRPCDDWLVPDWPVAPRVRSVCTTRNGGVSAAPWDSLNLGTHVGDAEAAVRSNRARLQHAIAARPIFLQQQHGCEMVELHERSAEGQAADACTTTQPRIACTVLVADCLPVLLADVHGTRVAAVHAGWRGLAAGILQPVLQRFKPVAQASQQHAAMNVVAWLGPCIGPFEFEVGAEVRHAFVAAQPDAAVLFAPCGQDKWRADLAGLARRQLHALGVASVHGNDGSAHWCTVRNPSRFFSHRRDTRRLGASGRLAACVWLT